MKSCIYEGRVSHRRFSPKRHSFDQKLYMLYLDLSELDRVFNGRWAWSTKRPALAWLRRSDHLGPATEDLDVSVRNFVESKSGARPDGPIRLLTHLRYFGFIMNPVSFYFCFSADQRLQHVVAEVNNTPWGEQHCYLLEPAHFAPPAGQSRKLSEKDFHVSPFLPMEMFYRWNISLQDDSLKIGIRNLGMKRKVSPITTTRDGTTSGMYEMERCRSHAAMCCALQPVAPGSRSQRPHAEKSRIPGCAAGA